MRALVCPGQGSQKKGFLSPWLEIEGVREHLERLDRKSTRLNSSHIQKSRMPSSA